jgi:purine-cytosine permease-like protein
MELLVVWYISHKIGRSILVIAIPRWLGSISQHIARRGNAHVVVVLVGAVPVTAAAREEPRDPAIVGYASAPGALALAGLASTTNA